MGKVILMLGIIFLTGCGINVNEVLSGSTHACGTIHIEGYLTDSQGEIVVVKAPEGWEPAQIAEFCSQ